MDSTITCAVNLVFALLIAGFSVLGYVLTIKRMGQRWPLWIVLATAWLILAIPYILFLAGLNLSVAVMAAIWLSSFILIIVSIALILIKFTEMMNGKKQLVKSSDQITYSNNQDRVDHGV